MSKRGRKCVHIDLSLFNYQNRRAGELKLFTLLYFVHVKKCYTSKLRKIIIKDYKYQGLEL